MKKIICIMLCAAMLCGICACQAIEDVSETPTAPIKKSDLVSVKELNSDLQPSLGKTLEDHGFDEAFFNHIGNLKSGNFMISPLSFRCALGLLLNGAEGTTKEEMLKALQIESTDEWTSYCLRFNGFVKDFYAQLEAEQKQNGEPDETDPAPTRALQVANSVWKDELIQEDFTAEYKECILKNYGAEQFTFNAENVVDKINSWVNEKTKKMIPRLLPDNYDTANLAIVLMNALYYKNNWQDPFETRATKDADFRTKDGKTVKKSFMEQTGSYAYYADGGTRLVIVPMEGGVNMAFVLGSANGITQKLAKAEHRQIHLKIPKMDFETSLDRQELVDYLKTLGISEAFDSNRADFSAMIPCNIWVDDIVQKTKIKTDESGAEAAAVTAIMMKYGAALTEEKPIDFIADEPFSFFIYADCGEITPILFAGRVVE